MKFLVAFFLTLSSINDLQFNSLIVIFQVREDCSHLAQPSGFNKNTKVTQQIEEKPAAGNNCKRKHLMKWNHGKTVLANWLYRKFFWYTASNIQSIEEIKSQMALLSLGNRSLKNKLLTYVSSLEDRNQEKKKHLQGISDSLPARHQHKSAFLQPASATQRNCRGEWRSRVDWKLSSAEGTQRLEV